MEPAIVHITTADDLTDLQALRFKRPAVPILAVITNADPELAVRAIELGASGVAPRLPAAELAALARRLPVIACPGAVIAGLQARCARLGEPPPASKRLTCREQQVLALLVDGRTARQIATRLGITFSTAQTHLKNLYRKLGTSSKAQATAIALRDRLI